MTVRGEVKAARRRAQAEKVSRERERTGFNAWQQYRARMAGFNFPLHDRINRRVRDVPTPRPAGKLGSDTRPGERREDGTEGT